MFSTEELRYRDEIRFEIFPAGGPGGQHANRNATAVRAVHIPTGLTAIARERRSQLQNRELALERLLHKLQARHRPVKPRIPTSLPPQAKINRRRLKTHRSRLKETRKKIVDSE